MVVTGKVWLFGDNLNSDQIMPVHHSLAEKEKLTCLNSVRPEFASSVAPGDVLVAGKHCGIGSSRPSPRILKYLGVGAVIADSFSGIFYRNAIAIGFPLIQIKDANKLFRESEHIRIDFEKGLVERVDEKKQIHFPPYPDLIREIFDAGGIIELLKKENKEKKEK